MSNLRERLAHLQSSVPSRVKIVAVSKYYPETSITEAYQAGQRAFGESKALDLSAKQNDLPKDIEWHFIGHLQTNKVKYIAPFVGLIHSIDSFKLLQEVEKQAGKCDRRIDVLLQIHIAQEETKFGFTFDECRTMLQESPWQTLSHVRIRGLMTIASNTADANQIHREFRSVKNFFDELKSSSFADEPSFDTFSAGMSHDYAIAIEEGSNLIRVGTYIFDEKQ